MRYDILHVNCVLINFCGNKLSCIHAVLSFFTKSECCAALFFLKQIHIPEMYFRSTEINGFALAGTGGYAQPE